MSVDDPSVSLTPLLRSSMASWADLRARYGGLLRLVDTMLGVVPNCDRYLEIWPPAFRTYNVMVPNLLNLPVPVLGVGGPPPAMVGLAMYVASRTAECPYCSAHSCSFAMRRGASPETVAAALLPGTGALGRGELATIAVARSLARVPCELTAAERSELVDAYGERKAEWIALGAVMMGFLNKFMDAIGVELEQSVVSEVAATIGPGWSPGKAGEGLDPTAPARPNPSVDGIRTRLRLVPLLPAAIRYDARAQKGVPSTWPAVGQHLLRATGHDFPVIEHLHAGRVRRTIASMLATNLDASTSIVGLEVKALVGAVYATIVDDEALARDVQAVARHLRVPEQRRADAISFARGFDDAIEGESPSARAALGLARDASPSPARITAATREACRTIEPAAIVESITWLAVLQMLHRLHCYVAAT